MTRVFAQASPAAIDRPRGERRRWCLSALPVVALHVGAALWLLRASALPAPAPIVPTAALLVELAPVQAPPPPPVPQPVPKTRTPPKPVAQPAKPTPVAESPPTEIAEPIEASAPAPADDAAPTEAPSTAEASPTLDLPSVPANWQNALLAHLQKHQRYPQRARSNRQQGVTYLRLSIGRDGELIASRIERSSGVAVLDEEALASVQRAQPLPPPRDATRFPVELIVPMQFIYQRR